MFKRRLLRFVPTVFMFCITVALLLFGTVALSEAFKLPDTGQTKCYAEKSGWEYDETSWVEIACAGTGQDGEYNINPMSFTDNGNGTVTDNNTGLMWQKGENPSTYNWYQASQNVCGSLIIGGYTDWRLPSKKELITIVDYGIPYPSPTIKTAYFPDTYASYYWSSTTYAGFTFLAWYVDFSYFGGVDGGISHQHSSKDDAYAYVRCVRGGK